MSREGQLVKNTLIISFGTIIPKLASVVTLPIITAGLTKAEYGTYDLVNTLVSLFLPIITMQLQSAAFRFLIEVRNNSKRTSNIISTILTFITMTSLVSLLILFFTLNNLAISTKLLICIYFFFDMYVQTLSQIIRGINKNAIYSISAILQALVNLVLVLIFIKWGNFGLNGLLLSLGGACITSTFFLIIIGKIFTFYSPRKFSYTTLKTMFQFSWPMIPNTLSLWVMNISDRLLLTFFLGVEVNAIYAVANKIPSLFGIVQNTFTYAWQENASISENDLDVSEYYSSIFLKVFNLLVGVMGLLIASTPVLFSLLIKGNYMEAYNQMPILFLGVFFSTISSFIGGIYVAKRKTKSVGITTLVAAMMNFLINVIFIKYIGIYAASISTLVSYMFLAFFRMYDVNKIQKLTYPWKRIVIALIVLGMMCIGCARKDFMLNIINILVAVLMFLFLNRNIISAVKQQICKIIK